ncbi:hypothetical protein FLAT13_03875 [Flavobacterium salmonis]|uniref:Uncharacterized protein n=1 Tax=Flavobacterium salmonis TaxID=2654844 RepID=A0A6V6Z6Q0_9FLAO|nr:hypothetical protein FLAT13_03875 [Flavobacterium salmonis]
MIKFNFKLDIGIIFKLSMLSELFLGDVIEI